jgi:hypothetical protein
MRFQEFFGLTLILRDGILAPVPGRPVFFSLETVRPTAWTDYISDGELGGATTAHYHRAANRIKCSRFRRQLPRSTIVRKERLVRVAPKKAFYLHDEEGRKRFSPVVNLVLELPLRVGTLVTRFSGM